MTVLQREPTNRSSLYDDVEDFGIEYKVNQAGNPPSNLLHYHECYEVILYVQSNNTAYVEDQRIDIQTQDLLFIAPWQIHKIIYTPSVAYSRYVIYFNEECIRRSFSQDNALTSLKRLNQKPCFKLTLSLTEFSRLSNALKSLTYHSSDPTCRGKKHYGAMSALYQSALPRGYQTGWSSKKLFLNKCYISRAFAQTMNTSFIQYLQFKRVIEAEKRLADTSTSILDVGLCCGFNNLQHFYRTFKKWQEWRLNNTRMVKLSIYVKHCPTAPGHMLDHLRRYALVIKLIFT